MSAWTSGETADLFDPVTGAWVGVKGKGGQEHLVPTLSTTTNPDGSVTVNGLMGVGGGVIALSFPKIMNTPVPITGNGSDQSMYSMVIPANSMGPNGILRITTDIVHPNNANAKSYRWKLGGQLLNQTATSGNLEIIYGVLIYNTNNTGAQLSPSIQTGYGSTTNAATAGTVDTTIDQVLQLVCNTTAGDVMTLKSFMVEIIRGN